MIKLKLLEFYDGFDDDCYYDESDRRAEMIDKWCEENNLVKRDIEYDEVEDCMKCYVDQVNYVISNYIGVKKEYIIIDTIYDYSDYYDDDNLDYGSADYDNSSYCLSFSVTSGDDCESFVLEYEYDIYMNFYGEVNNSGKGLLAFYNEIINVLRNVYGIDANVNEFMSIK